jgi:prepilin-type N-terminal cleavage/methylation domain-containing protein/prepilin-type processing-associated H-X9-DG protein
MRPGPEGPGLALAVLKKGCDMVGVGSSTGRFGARYAHGFTLVELLVVIGIISVLIGILLPTLARVRASSRSIKCMSNLRQISQGLVLYSIANKGYVIPSYNLPSTGAGANVTGGPTQPLEGWPCILDRDKFVASKEQHENTVFFCPDTVDVEGMKDGQTALDPGKPRGWTDWPLKFTSVGGDSAPKVAVTIPELGFNKIIRCSYWINAYNPVGSAPADISTADVHYTASVGLGPDGKGNYIRLHKTSGIRRSSQLIVVSDGLYMGRQSVTRLGDANSRIGYRHPGIGKANGSANVGFADGHCEVIEGNKFPRAGQKEENFGGPTVYASPERVFPQ